MPTPEQTAWLNDPTHHTEDTSDLLPQWNNYGLYDDGYTAPLSRVDLALIGGNLPELQAHWDQQVWLFCVQSGGGAQYYRCTGVPKTGSIVTVGGSANPDGSIEEWEEVIIAGTGVTPDRTERRRKA